MSFCILFIERNGRDILQITVYFDVIFLINFIVDFTVLYLTGVITKKKIRFVKLIIGAVFASMSLLVFILFPFLLIGWKGIFILVGISIGAVAIPYWERRWSFVRTWFLSTTIMVLIGSIMNYLRYIFHIAILQILQWTLLFAVSVICIMVFLLCLRKTIKRNNNMYLVQIKHREKMVLETLYMDTGNLLIDPIFQKPVVVLSENVVCKCMIEEEQLIVEQYIKSGRLNYDDLLSCQTQKTVCFHEISYQSVGSMSGKILCMLMDEMRVLGEDSVLIKQPVAIVSDDLFAGRVYQGLLHKECI